MKKFLRKWLGIADCEVVIQRMEQRLGTLEKRTEESYQGLEKWKDEVTPKINVGFGMATSTVPCIHCGTLVRISRAVPVKYTDHEGKISNAFLCKRDEHRASGRIALAPANAIPRGTPGKVHP